MFCTELSVYIFCGDNQFHKERGITDENIIGVVTAFYRKGKHYTDNSLSYRFYKSAWEYIKAPMRMLYSAHRMNKSIKIKKKLLIDILIIVYLLLKCLENVMDLNLSYVLHIMDVLND